MPAALRDALDAAFAGAASDAAEDARAASRAASTWLGLRAIKGLEFDAAIVIEPAAILGERPDGGAGGLYTALTRSTRALAVVHAEPLPAAIASAPDLRRVDVAGAAEAWAAGRRRPAASPACPPAGRSSVERRMKRRSDRGNEGSP